MTDRWSYQPEPEDDGMARRSVAVKRPVTAAVLAEALEVKVFQVIKDLIEYRIFAKNGNTSVNDDTAIRVAEKHGVHLVIED
jgi:translation initiation factor IF-2